MPRGNGVQVELFSCFLCPLGSSSAGVTELNTLDDALTLLLESFFSPWSSYAWWNSSLQNSKNSNEFGRLAVLETLDWLSAFSLPIPDRKQTWTGLKIGFYWTSRRWDGGWWSALTDGWWVTDESNSPGAKTGTYGVVPTWDWSRTFFFLTKIRRSDGKEERQICGNNKWLEERWWCCFKGYAFDGLLRVNKQERLVYLFFCLAAWIVRWDGG